MGERLALHFGALRVAVVVRRGRSVQAHTFEPPEDRRRWSYSDAELDALMPKLAAIATRRTATVTAVLPASAVFLRRVTLPEDETNLEAVQYAAEPLLPMPLEGLHLVAIQIEAGEATVAAVPHQPWGRILQRLDGEGWICPRAVCDGELLAGFARADAQTTDTPVSQQTAMASVIDPDGGVAAVSQAGRLLGYRGLAALGSQQALYAELERTAWGATGDRPSGPIDLWLPPIMRWHLNIAIDNQDNHHTPSAKPSVEDAPGNDPGQTSHAVGDLGAASLTDEPAQASPTPPGSAPGNGPGNAPGNAPGTLPGTAPESSEDQQTLPGADSLNEHAGLRFHRLEAMLAPSVPWTVGGLAAQLTTESGTGRGEATNLRRGALASARIKKRTWRIAAAHAAAVTVVLLMIAGALVHQGRQFEQRTASYKQQTRAVWQKLHPDKPVPKNVLAELISQRKRERGLREAADKVPSYGSSLDVMAQALDALPSDIPLRVREIDIAGEVSVLTGQAKSHGAVERLASGLSAVNGLSVRPPRTERTPRGPVRFTLRFQQKDDDESASADNPGAV